MIKILSCYFLFSLILINQSFIPVLSQRTFLDNPDNLRLYRFIRARLIKTIGSTSVLKKSLDENIKLNKLQEKIPQNISFPCDVKGWRSNVVPTSVHRLKPGDIDIIATMGDSLSAGSGIFALNMFELFVDNRGVSALGGGQNTWREYITLPNILKEFNPNLYGYSKGDYSTLEKASKLNIAEAGAVSGDLSYMASVLIKRLKSDPRVDMKNHWKIISLMIGANDFCLFMCTVPSTEFLANHERDMVKTLRIIRDNIPRTFVSLIQPPNLKSFIKAREMSRPSLYCELFNSYECPCLFGLIYRDKRQEYYEIMKRWQELDLKISKYPEFQKDNFTVVVQPLLSKLQFPIDDDDDYTDPSFLTNDCFHISQKSNSFYAVNLWNSLLLPYEEKPKNVIINLKNFKCPTKKNPYLNTYINERFTEDTR